MLMTNERCIHDILLTATPPCPFCERDRLRAALAQATALLAEQVKLWDGWVFAEESPIGRIRAFVVGSAPEPCPPTPVPTLAGEGYKKPGSQSEPRTEPETPFGWFRMDGGKIVFAMGAWPPPEPDDTAWSPLYSSPAGRPALADAPHEHVWEVACYSDGQGSIADGGPMYAHEVCACGAMRDRELPQSALKSGAELRPVPQCKHPGCTLYVESGEEYCSDHL